MRASTVAFAAAALLAAAVSDAWTPHHRSAAGLRLRRPRPVTRTVVVAAGDGLDDIEMMKAGEMKAELDMRGVSYVGCYDKTDLKELLLQSRAEGRADPAVIDEVSSEISSSSSLSTGTPHTPQSANQRTNPRHRAPRPQKKQIPA